MSRNYNSPTVAAMVTWKLHFHGFTGLHCGECCCRLPDLMPCGAPIPDQCRGGYVAVTRRGGVKGWTVGAKRAGKRLNEKVEAPQ